MPNRGARIDHKLKLKYLLNRTTYRDAACVEKKEKWGGVPASPVDWTLDSVISATKV